MTENTMTLDEARIQIIAQEAADQKASDLRRIADLRVQILQYEQEVARLRAEVTRLTPVPLDDATTESDPNEVEDH